MWNGIDKRKFPRAHYKCVIYIAKQNDLKAISTRTENIGEGGVCVVVNEDFGLFKGVNLEVDLENGIPGNIKCSGTVVWVVRKHDIRGSAIQYDTGIEFVDMDDESRGRIATIVQKQMDDYPADKK